MHVNDPYFYAKLKYILYHEKSMNNDKNQWTITKDRIVDTMRVSLKPAGFLLSH
jgi:hypothetical protein